MSRSLAVALLFVSSVASAGVEVPILGGTTTTVGQFPNVVGLEVGNGMCTGTLITPDWVLTAAHCIQGLSPSSVTVRFGSVSMFSGGATRGASMLIPKPGFSQSALGRYDIGLIKLAAPITDIKPVPVNLNPAKAPVGIKVTMVGFGATSVGGGGAGTQFMVEQTSVSCQSFGSSNTELLCFSQTNGTGKCSGDSGGPSFAMIDGVFTQVGVTSFGDQDCQYYGADTRTDVEKAFLLQHVPQLECEYDSDCDVGRMCFNKKCIVTPFAEGGLGAECGGNGDCDSMVCASDGENRYCSDTCAMGVEGACPMGLDCIDTGDGTGACWPNESGGCCDARGAGAPTAMFGLLFVGLVLRRKRRR